MAVKLDMNKAYDRVEWAFLKEVMLRKRFAEEWVALVIRCISTVSYVVNINGNRGNVLNLLEGSVKTFISDKDANKRGRGPTISHLLFADDCILFGEAKNRGAMILKDILKECEICFGQYVNFNKSAIFYSSNTAEGNKEEISAVMSVKCSTNLKKYLGLRNMVGRWRKESFQNLKDMVKQITEKWSTSGKKERERKGYIGANGNLCVAQKKTGEWAAKGILAKGLCWRMGTDAREILRNPLARVTHDDFLVWGGESSGAFSWKFGQHCQSRIFSWLLTWNLYSGLPGCLISLPLSIPQFLLCTLGHMGDRNTRIHEKRISTCKEIVNFISNYIVELNGLEKRKSVITKETRSWSHPPREFIKINFNSAYDRNYNHSALEIHQGVVSAFAAEAIACRKAVQIRVEKKWSAIIIK
ncbi:hypothetical protein PVK06_042501 [Gossypium arboreum]|uniref:Reverse transcriptase n=1 Tax=Gossypium arboreum TaxID=29729 RepID=A0ABR0MLG8_GOSAR|nr:hypothetical protein PVK06_042501 [Gossypium arboreum]